MDVRFLTASLLTFALGIVWLAVNAYKHIERQRHEKELDAELQAIRLNLIATIQNSIQAEETVLRVFGGKRSG